MPEPLPDFPFDASPRSDRCERCGADGDLRFVIVRGRDRYVGRTVCDTCSETVIEALYVSDIYPDGTST